jgi:hypothetical protein
MCPEKFLYVRKKISTFPPHLLTNNFWGEYIN